jgi:hypothetical protein
MTTDAPDRSAPACGSNKHGNSRLISAWKAGAIRSEKEPGQSIGVFMSL